MATFDELKNKGNVCFKEGKLDQAIELYTKALELSPIGYVALSNRSLAFYKLEKYEQALEDADKCTQVNGRWAKGHLRRAAALIALGRFKEAKKACVVGFSLQEQRLCDLIVDEWMKASKALVSDKFDHLKNPPWSDVIPDAAELFCDEYCDLLFTITYLRLSDSDSMSHEMMVKCVQGAVEISEKVLSEFQHPSTSLLREWAEAATIQFESYPKSKWGKLMTTLQQKTSDAVKWFKNDVHKALRKVLEPVLILALSAMLVRGNVLSQAYTGHNATEYLGCACVGFFEQGVFKDPVYTGFHLAVLSLILNSYRLRGALSDDQIQLIREICHKMESLLHHLPKSNKNYDAIVQHYQHTIKVFREICAKVISGFSGSHDPAEALSELEAAFLECDSNPDKATATAVKYLTDIASKTKASQSGPISHINFIDAENMLYITGILAKLGDHDQALRVFHSGESMALSLLATVMEKNVLSLNELPASVTNCRQFALSGAIWLKDHFPEVAADVFIRWKSFFTELRAVLIQLGLRGNYRAAFQAIESEAMESGESESESDVLKTFQVHENQVHQRYALSTIRALYDQDYKAVAQALGKSDVAIDYTFNIYNPEHRNPPESQACAVVIRPQEPPVLFLLENALVYGLLQKWPQAIYKLWLSEGQEFDQVSKAMSDALFPDEVKKILLAPSVKRVFISPDADLMCFPIDQLPLTDDSSTTLPLFERFAVSILSSPRELVRAKVIATIKVATEEQKPLNREEEDSKMPTEGKEMATAEALVEARLSVVESATASKKPSGESAVSTKEHVIVPPAGEVSALQTRIGELQVCAPDLECYIVANPDYKHERPLEQKATSSSAWAKWLGAFSGLLGSGTEDESHHIQELEGSQREAEVVHGLLAANASLKVHSPVVLKDAHLSAVLNLKSPHILHIATHGYSSKQTSTRYHGNFWTDQSSGILLAGAQTFREKKFDRMDAKAGTGHMNAIAACGMQLDGTRLVFVSACNSSVGTRPAQEMPDSFTQALRAAGAETVVSTLWTVTDTEAAEFVGYFYDRLMNTPQCCPSEALRYAKVTMKRSGKSMFYWGTYVCQGLDKPLA